MERHRLDEARVGSHTNRWGRRRWTGERGYGEGDDVHYQFGLPGVGDGGVDGLPAVSPALRVVHRGPEEDRIRHDPDVREQTGPGQADWEGRVGRIGAVHREGRRAGSVGRWVELDGDVQVVARADFGREGRRPEQGEVR